MKSSTKYGLGYTGIVTLSQCIGGKKYIKAKLHNSGSSPLFTFLYDCLIGDFSYARNKMPAKIRLVQLKKADGGVTSAKSGNTDFIGLLCPPERLASSESGYPYGCVRYSFAIPVDYLDTKTFNAICLYPSYTTEDTLYEYAACCEVKLGDISINDSSMLLVDWDLIFVNSTTADSSNSA